MPMIGCMLVYLLFSGVSGALVGGGAVRRVGGAVRRRPSSWRMALVSCCEARRPEAIVMIAVITSHASSSARATVPILRLRLPLKWRWCADNCRHAEDLSRLTGLTAGK